jgi:hypothetical protein
MAAAKLLHSQMLAIFAPKRQKDSMINQVSRYLAGVFYLCTALVFLPALQAADANHTGKRDATSVINEAKLRKLTDLLVLTVDQQKKIQALLEEEGKVTRKLQEDEKLSFTDRNEKMKEARQGTYAKIKPMLTPEQLDKFEKALAETNTPKKKAKAPAPK